MVFGPGLGVGFLVLPLNTGRPLGEERSDLNLGLLVLEKAQ